MRPNLRGTGVKSINAYVDLLARRFPQSEEYIHKVDLEQDRKITKRFPYFIGVSLIIWLIITYLRGEVSFEYCILYLCFSFIMCFTVLGMYCFFRMDHGPVPKTVIAVNAMVLSIVMVLFGELTNNLDFVTIFANLLNWFGFRPDYSLLLIISIVGVMAVVLFATSGVLFIISAYLRRYIPSLFVGLIKDAHAGERGPIESFFMVPDIIDVKDVVLEPEIDYHRLNSEMMFDIMAYICLIGVLISSYLFLNPLFLETMEPENMLSIMFMLSVFVPSLIFPWMVVKYMGAQAVSEAPRPYYLWNGAKRRLFGSFLTLGAFLMLFLLSLYFGYDIVDIFMKYVYLLVPMAGVAWMFALIYANNYSNTVNVSIFSRYNEKLNAFLEKERSGLPDRR